MALWVRQPFDPSRSDAVERTMERLKRPLAVSSVVGHLLLLIGLFQAPALAGATLACQLVGSMALTASCRHRLFRRQQSLLAKCKSLAEHGDRHDAQAFSRCWLSEAGLLFWSGRLVPADLMQVEERDDGHLAVRIGPAYLASARAAILATIGLFLLALVGHLVLALVASSQQLSTLVASNLLFALFWSVSACFVGLAARLSIGGLVDCGELDAIRVTNPPSDVVSTSH